MNKLSQNLKDLEHQNQQPNYTLYFVRKLSSLLPNCTLVDIGKVTARQRMIKSKEEIEVEMTLFLLLIKLPLQTHPPLKTDLLLYPYATKGGMYREIHLFPQGCISQCLPTQGTIRSISQHGQGRIEFVMALASVSVSSSLG